MDNEQQTESQILQVSNDGKIRDIQMAIKMAKPNQIIRVSNGFYKGFVVSKPGLTIEAVNGHDNVVIIADKGDSIVVDCGPGGQVTLRNLKVAHTVSKTELDINRLINLFFKRKKVVKSENIDYNSVIARDYSRSLTQVCLLRVIRGDVYVARCSFSFKIISKSLETVIPAVVVERKASLFLSACEIVGHRIYQTTGVINYRGNLTMNDCKVYCNLNGGISIMLGNIIRQRTKDPNRQLRDHAQPEVRSRNRRSRRRSFTDWKFNC